MHHFRGRSNRCLVTPQWLLAAGVLLAITASIAWDQAVAQPPHVGRLPKVADAAGEPRPLRIGQRERRAGTVRYRFPASRRRGTATASAGRQDAEHSASPRFGPAGLSRQVAWQTEVPSDEQGELPELAGPYEVPLAGSEQEEIVLEESDGLISLVARNASLQDVLNALAETQGLNIVTAAGLDATLTITLERVRLEDALDAILSAAGFTWAVNDQNIIHVTSLAAAAEVTPTMQGRRVETFQLDFATADDVNTVITGMLSPVGRSFAISSEETDNRRSREVLVVEDLPRYLARIRDQVALIDVPPRQVLIQVYILQIELDDDNKHGIDFDHSFNLSRNVLQLQTTGFANSSSSQAFFLNLSGGNLTGLLEALQSTTDSKTLASPKILCLNGQTSRIQVGEQLGFRVTTTTETSTTESVEFLDVGVVLEVTPRISRDGRVMLRISPEVSSGEVSASTGLPEEATTELQTDVLLGDNHGIVIGGLIQETDNDIQAKVHGLGDLHFLGKLFQRKETRKNRSEIIIALLPRIIPYDPIYQQQEDVELTRARTPLLCGPLIRNPRPWEPRLYDALDNPKPVRLPPLHQIFRCRMCKGAGCVSCQPDGPHADSVSPAQPAYPVESGYADPASAAARWQERAPNGASLPPIPPHSMRGPGDRGTIAVPPAVHTSRRRPPPAGPASRATFSRPPDREIMPVEYRAPAGTVLR